MKTFSPTTEMLDAAKSLCIAMAHEQLIRPIVASYQKKVLESRVWPVRPDFTRIERESVTDITLTYLMSEADVDEFVRLCQIEEKAHNLAPKKAGNCPLLEAESNVRNSRFALAKLMEPVSPITEAMCRAMNSEDFNRTIELYLRLLAPYLANEGKKITPAEHRKMKLAMETQREILKDRKKSAGTLAEKLAVAEEIKELNEKLRQHLLNYFELVAE